jgi:hypothetical protein
MQNRTSLKTPAICCFQHAGPASGNSAPGIHITNAQNVVKRPNGFSCGELFQANEFSVFPSSNRSRSLKPLILSNLKGTLWRSAELRKKRRGP